MTRHTAALLLLLFISIGCNRGGDSPKKLRFAIIPKAVGIPVFDYARTGAEREAKKLGEIEILWRGPETVDEIRQKEIFESFVAQRVDGIAISCLNGDLLTDAINHAVESGIPVITWDSDAPKSKRLAFYGVNDFEAGKALGEGLAKLVKGQGKVAMLTALGADNLQKRLDGARSALMAHPEIEIVEVYDIKDDPVRVAEVIAGAAQRYPDLAGLLAVGGWPVFVRNALDPIDPARTMVVAFDTIPPAPDILRAGKVQMLVGQKYFGWGEQSVQILKQIIDGHPPQPPIQYSGMDLVTRENLDAYLEQWRQWEKG